MNADQSSSKRISEGVALVTPLPWEYSLARARQAFTLLELLLVVSIIAILAALLLPSLSKAQAKGKRARCLNNLKQIGIGFHSFLHDHGDKFPMQVSTNSGGSL